MPFGSVSYENKTDENGDRLIWLERRWLDRLKSYRCPGESYSDVILRLGREDGRAAGGELMTDTWTLTFTDANGRVGTKTYDNETAFISGVLDKLTDLRTSNVSAVLPDGTKLDGATLTAKYVK